MPIAPIPRTLAPPPPGPPRPGSLAGHWRYTSANLLERLNGEIKRRADVVAIVPNEGAIVRLIGPLMLVQNLERTASRARDASLEQLARSSHDPQAGRNHIAAA